MVLAVGIIQINVTDLQVAWDFYVETLGIPGHWRLGRNRAFALDLGDGPTVLVYPVERKATQGYPNETGVVLVLRTDNVRRLVRKWKAHGVMFHPAAWAAADGIAESPFGPFIAFEDPFGNIHEIIENSE